MVHRQSLAVLASELEAFLGKNAPLLSCGGEGGEGEGAQISPH